MRPALSSLVFHKRDIRAVLPAATRAFPVAGLHLKPAPASPKPYTRAVGSSKVFTVQLVRKQSRLLAWFLLLALTYTWRPKLHAAEYFVIAGTSL